MRALLDGLCLWTGRLFWTVVVVLVVYHGIEAVYDAGVARGRAQTAGFQSSAPAHPPAHRPTHPPRPAAPPPPVVATPEPPIVAPPAVVAPAPPAQPRRLTIEVTPDGACRIGIDVPADPAMRRRYIHQRRQLGHGPC